ncbi:DUF397 domain-containing protein [Streptomyces sp. NPDC018019]
MSIPTWQKSSYSGNASNCIELTEAADKSVLLRDGRSAERWSGRLVTEC